MSKDVKYIITIVVLTITLGILWFLIIDSNNKVNNNNYRPDNNNSSVTYSSVKEINKEQKMKI